LPHTTAHSLRLGATWFRQAPSWAQQPTASEDTMWWNAPCESEQGGVVFMRRGQRCDRVDVLGMCEGVCRSLRLAHSVGVLHCDLRLSNVLQFGANFRLVDFGLSCTVKGENNDPYELQKGGSQAAGVGPRLHQLLGAGEKVVWTVADDYEMLLRMLGVFQSL
jgi:hypothetical protein